MRLLLILAILISLGMHSAFAQNAQEPASAQAERQETSALYPSSQVGLVPRTSTRSARLSLSNGIDYLETYGDPGRALMHLERASSLKDELSPAEQNTLQAARLKAKRILEGTEPARTLVARKPKSSKTPNKQSNVPGSDTPDPLVNRSIIGTRGSKLDESFQRTLVQTEGRQERAVSHSQPAPLTLPEFPAIVDLPEPVREVASTPPLNLDQLPVISSATPQGYDRTPAYIASPYAAYHRDYYLPTRYNPNYDRSASDPPPYPPRRSDWRPSGKLWYSARSAPWYYGYWYYPRHVGVPDESPFVPCPEGVACSHRLKPCR